MRFLTIIDGQLMDGSVESTPVLELYRPSAFWHDIAPVPLGALIIEGGGLVNDRIHVCSDSQCLTYDPVASDWVTVLDRTEEFDEVMGSVITSVQGRLFSSYDSFSKTFPRIF